MGTNGKVPEQELQAAITTIVATMPEAAPSLRAALIARLGAGVGPMPIGDPTHLTELGNAARLVRRFGAYLRHVRQWGWMVWDGRRWRRDEAAALQFAKATALAIYQEAADCEDKDRRAELASWAVRSESEAKLRAMLGLAESEPGIACTADQFDRDFLILNCQNGVVDLRTGALRAHDPADMCTKIAGAAYDPAATCPLWLACLERIMAGSQSLIAFLQRAAGYSLTGVISEQALFFCHGVGANGKSTFLETLRAVLGDYGQQADFSTFLERNSEGPRNDIARMAGARYVTAIEMGEGRRLAESLVKQLTGDDVIAARFLHKEFFEFVPQFKLFLAANHKPVIRGTDYAIWRRIKLVPFTVTIPESEQDQQLKSKLLAELPGILMWALEGAQAWLAGGLEAPEEVRAATAEYRAEMDTLAAWQDECCVTGPGKWAKTGDLWTTYVEWAKANNEHEGTQKAFGMRLKERGFVQGRLPGGRVRIWHGIGLLDQPAQASLGEVVTHSDL